MSIRRNVKYPICVILLAAIFIGVIFHDYKVGYDSFKTQANKNFSFITTVPENLVDISDVIEIRNRILSNESFVSAKTNNRNSVRHTFRTYYGLFLVEILPQSIYKSFHKAFLPFFVNGGSLFRIIQFQKLKDGMK